MRDGHFRKSDVREAALSYVGPMLHKRDQSKVGITTGYLEIENHGAQKDNADMKLLRACNLNPDVLVFKLQHLPFVTTTIT